METTLKIVAIQRQFYLKLVNAAFSPVTRAIAMFCTSRIVVRSHDRGSEQETRKKGGDFGGVGNQIVVFFLSSVNLICFVRIGSCPRSSTSSFYRK